MSIIKKSLILVISFLLIFSFTLTLTVNSLTPGRAYQEEDYIKYIIGEGDTFYRLSRKFNISVNQIQELNPNLDPHSLQIGEEVLFSIGDFNYHVVEKGDTLWKISQHYNYALNSIIEYNEPINPSYLLPGEVIILPEAPPTVDSVLYFLRYTQEDAFLVPERREIPVETNFYKSIIEELIKGPEGEDMYMPIPPETQVLSLIVDNGTANVDFSEEVKGANVGGEGEYLLIQAITNSLTEYREIEEVNIYIGGRFGDTIGGHIELNRSFGRDLEVVRYY